MQRTTKKVQSCRCCKISVEGAVGTFPNGGCADDQGPSQQSQEVIKEPVARDTVIAPQGTEPVMSPGLFQVPPPNKKSSRHELEAVRTTMKSSVTPMTSLSPPVDFMEPCWSLIPQQLSPMEANSGLAKCLLVPGVIPPSRTQIPDDAAFVGPLPTIPMLPDWAIYIGLSPTP